MNFSSPQTQRAGVRMIVLAVCMLLAIGCGPRDRVIVEGQVTYDGEQVMNGDIRFQPMEGTKGSTIGAPIADGRYRVQNKQGLPIGRHHVVIRAFILENAGAVVAGSADNDLLSGPVRQKQETSLPTYVVEGRQQFLPHEYNQNSTLTVEVTGEVDPQQADFHLDPVDRP